jgi:hypothetical protein
MIKKEIFFISLVKSVPIFIAKFVRTIPLPINLSVISSVLHLFLYNGDVIGHRVLLIGQCPEAGHQQEGQTSQTGDVTDSSLQNFTGTS